MIRIDEGERWSDERRDTIRIALRSAAADASEGDLLLVAAPTTSADRSGTMSVRFTQQTRESERRVSASLLSASLLRATRSQ